MNNQEPQNLMDGIISEMNRVREIITQYKRLPGNVGGIASSLMADDIKDAEQSIKDGNVIQMMICYSKLKEWEM